MTQTTGSVSRTGVNSLSDVVLHCSSLDLAKGFCCGRTGFFAASSKRTNDHHLLTTTGSSRDENRVHSSCQARVEDAILHLVRQNSAISSANATFSASRCTEHGGNEFDVFTGRFNQHPAPTAASNADAGSVYGAPRPIGHCPDPRAQQPGSDEGNGNALLLKTPTASCHSAAGPPPSNPTTQMKFCIHVMVTTGAAEGPIDNASCSGGTTGLGDRGAAAQHVFSAAETCTAGCLLHALRGPADTSAGCGEAGGHSLGVFCDQLLAQTASAALDEGYDATTGTELLLGGACEKRQEPHSDLTATRTQRGNSADIWSGCREGPTGLPFATCGFHVGSDAVVFFADCIGDPAHNRTSSCGVRNRLGPAAGWAATVCALRSAANLQPNCNEVPSTQRPVPHCAAIVVKAAAADALASCGRRPDIPRKNQTGGDTVVFHAVFPDGTIVVSSLGGETSQHLCSAEGRAKIAAATAGATAYEPHGPIAPMPAGYRAPLTRYRLSSVAETLACGESSAVSASDGIGNGRPGRGGARNIPSVSCWAPARAVGKTALVRNTMLFRAWHCANYIAGQGAPLSSPVDTSVCGVRAGEADLGVIDGGMGSFIAVDPPNRAAHATSGSDVMSGISPPAPSEVLGGVGITVVSVSTTRQLFPQPATSGGGARTLQGTDDGGITSSGVLFVLRVIEGLLPVLMSRRFPHAEENGNPEGTRRRLGGHRGAHMTNCFKVSVLS
jgi:hypothetical protein